MAQDCKAREAAQQERSRAHAGEPGSASSGVAVRSASRGPALAQTLSADTVEPGSASSSQIQASQTAVDRHIHEATRRLADDGRRYTWEEFATYYRIHADAMWKRAWEREMAIWSRVVTRLEENLRRSRWRIIARKMNRFAGVCLIHAYRRIHPRRVVPLFEDDWLSGRTPAPEPWDDYNSDSPSRRRILGRETF